MSKKEYEKELAGKGMEEEAVAGEVVNAISDDNDTDAGDLFEFLSRMKGLLEDDDEDDDDIQEDEEENDMDADDYHNKAVDYAHQSKYKSAAACCMNGLKRFPLNVDLLSDTIKYSSEAGDMEVAAKHFAILKTIPVQCWNWRAYSFTFDYLMENPIANEEECRMIVENFKKYIPYEEKAYMAESRLEMALGNSERSMKILEEAIASRENASVCALRLADMQMDRGLYEKVIATINYGIAASAEAQPSINIPYLYYIRTLAKDHILHKKECNHEVVEKREVDALAAEYELLLSEFPELMRYAHVIQMRTKMLKFMNIE